MAKKKNAAAVALGKLAASKRGKADLAEAGRRGMASRWGKNGTPDERTTPVEVADPSNSTTKKKL